MGVQTESRVSARGSVDLIGETGLVVAVVGRKGEVERAIHGHEGKTTGIEDSTEAVEAVKCMGGGDTTGFLREDPQRARGAPSFTFAGALRD